MVLGGIAVYQAISGLAGPFVFLGGLFLTLTAVIILVIEYILSKSSNQILAMILGVFYLLCGVVLMIGFIVSLFEIVNIEIRRVFWELILFLVLYFSAIVYVVIYGWYRLVKCSADSNRGFYVE